MNQRVPQSAGIISIILAVVLLLAIYTLLGTVDLIYMTDGNESAVHEDANVFSELHFPEGVISCTVNGEETDIGNVNDLRVQIGATVLSNFLGFKWTEEDNVIIVNVVGGAQQ